MAKSQRDVFRRRVRLVSALLGVVAASACVDQAPGSSGADAGVEAGLPDAIVMSDSAAPQPDADAAVEEVDAAPNPCIHVLPPTGQHWGSATHSVNSGTNVVYTDVRGAPEFKFEVYYFDLVTMTEHQLTNREGYQSSPWIHGNEIIYSDQRNEDFSIEFYQTLLYSYDIVAATEILLDDSVHLKWRSVFNEQFLLYLTEDVCDFPQTRLLVKNRSSGVSTPLVDCGWLGGAGGYHLSGSVATWVQRTGNDEQVYVADLSTATATELYNPESRMPLQAQTDGQYVVWADSRLWNLPYVLYLYDLSTGVETELDPTGWAKYRPRLRNGILAWDDFRHSQEVPGWNSLQDVYVYEIATGAGRRVTAQSNEWHTRYVDAGWIVYALEHKSFEYQLFAHDLVCDGILTPDGHAIPAPSP